MEKTAVQTDSHLSFWQKLAARNHGASKTVIECRNLGALDTIIKIREEEARSNPNLSRIAGYKHTLEHMGREDGKDYFAYLKT